MTPLEQVINWFQERCERKNGGRSALARYLNVAPGAITYWEHKGRIPKAHVQLIARKTGIPKSKLRPDLWQKDEQ